MIAFATLTILIDRVKRKQKATPVNFGTFTGEIKKHHTRSAGLATLPVNVPEAAAEGLERAVTQLGIKGAMIAGLANDYFLDEPQYFPIFEMAAKLDVLIYLHPGMVRESERKMLYHCKLEVVLEIRQVVTLF